jgi:drug/metabolite transporter (DMT)-like permease
MSGRTSLAKAESGLADLLPGIGAALTYSAGDILAKIVFNDGMDVLSFITARGVLTVGFFWLWLRQAPPPRSHTPRERMVSVIVGLIFSANIFTLLLAVKLLPLSIAILTYFTYPLFTGLFGAVTGIDRVHWRGLLAAFVAFLGLALMLETRRGDVSTLGIVCALTASVGRTITLLITRAALRGTDSRLNTWYSLVPSAALFLLATLLTSNWNAPQTSLGWAAFVGMCIATTVPVLLIFVAIARIGPFRTALIMNLEPLVSTLGSIALLGEVLRPLQALGGAIMLAALCTFQIRR